MKAEDEGEQAVLARTLPCCACRIEGRTVAAHWISKATTGKAADIVPLCCTGPDADPAATKLREGCHEFSHRIGEASFWELVWRTRRLRPAEIAAGLASVVAGTGWPDGADGPP